MTGPPSDALELADAWGRPDPDRHPERAEEYERLFVGPGPVPCPPYESYWRDDVSFLLRRSLMGPCVGDLVELYARLGLRMPPDSTELPDHVAVELEALAFARSAEDTADVARTLLDQHLRRWLPVFCEAVKAESGDPFYVALADETCAWVLEQSRPEGGGETNSPNPGTWVRAVPMS